MTQLSLSINNRTYQVACDDGQEEHVTRLASFLESRVSELAGSMGQIGDARLLVMAGLLVSDELSEVMEELEQARAEIARLSEAVPAADASNADVAMIDEVTRRIEAIAEKLEGA